MGYKLDDYVEVADRIRAWHDKHPEGRIVSEILERPEDGGERWVVKASAYRTGDSLEPPAGVGHSFLTVPGKTNFTRDSELENAETSAAGRALVMAGIPAKSIASASEIASKREGWGGEPEAYGEGVSGEPPDSCAHDWEPSNARKGWNRCKKCGGYKEAA